MIYQGVQSLTADPNYTYCAIITHKGLNKSVEEECYTESVLPIYVEKRIKHLNFEWELLNFKQCESILIDGLNISKNIDWDNFIKRNQFDIENPVISNFACTTFGNVKCSTFGNIECTTAG